MNTASCSSVNMLILSVDVEPSLSDPNVEPGDVLLLGAPRRPSDPLLAVTGAEPVLLLRQPADPAGDVLASVELVAMLDGAPDTSLVHQRDHARLVQRADVVGDRPEADAGVAGDLDGASAAVLDQPRSDRSAMRVRVDDVLAAHGRGHRPSCRRFSNSSALRRNSAASSGVRPDTLRSRAMRSSSDLTPMSLSISVRRMPT